MSQGWLKPLFRVVGDARCRAWDLIHGVDTCGDLPLANLSFESENKSPGLEYQSHHPAIIRNAFSSLKIRYQDFTLVDFGCGKGRVLLVASEFPFRRIVGLEFAPQLADIARTNIKNYRSLNRQCLEIEAITADATQYQLVREPQVLYFFSPFARQVLDQVVENIERSLQESPRELLVLFSGVLGMRDAAFGTRPAFQRLHRERYMDVYRYRKDAGDNSPHFTAGDESRL